MTDQRPIDPSTLRDGDIVRAKRGEYGVVEGMFCRLDRGGWCLHDGPKRARETAWSAAGWTITAILRPVRLKGDRVEWTNVVTPRQGTYVGPREGGRPGYPQQSIVTNAEGRDVIVETDLLTRLPASPESDPVCPFPMGARVVPVDGWTKAAKIVTDWHPVTPGAPFVVWTRPESMPDGCETWAPADYWTLAPEPAPIEVGDWWADEKGIPHVVEVLHDDSVGLRRWTASVVNRFVEPSLLRDYWTRLDGPPEPPEGSVVRLGQKGNRIPLAAMRCNDVWRVTGYQEPLSWADLTGSATVDLATLQIVHTLGVE